MHTARDERMAAAYLPQSNVISVLYEQHAQIRDHFEAVATLRGAERKAVFDALCELLAKHEAAEEVVLRPVTEKLLPTGLLQARDVEEANAARELARLERIDVESPEFVSRLRLLEEVVSLHESREETDEFAAVLSGLSECEQQQMGRWVLRAMQPAPAHSHPRLDGSPARQAAVGRFAARLDRARDRLAETSHER